MKNNKYMNQILLFVFVFLLAYTLGVSIINVINNRLENISIQMPKVEVQQPDVTLKYDPFTSEFKTVPKPQNGAGNLLGYKETPNLSPLPPLATVSTTQCFDDCNFKQCGGKAEDTTKSKTTKPTNKSTCGRATVPDGSIHSPKGQTTCSDVKKVTSGCAAKKRAGKSPENDKYVATQGCNSSDCGTNSSNTTCGLGKCSNDSQCNTVYGRGANKCVNGKCVCRYGAGEYCQQEPTYYLDPCMMSPQQVIKFKNKAKLEMMTLQDYKNWLSLFSEDLENLPVIHRKNYWRLKSGDAITIIPMDESDLPAEDLRGMDIELPTKTDSNGEIIPPGTIGNIGGAVNTQQTANIQPVCGSGDLMEVKLLMPAVEVDTPINYRFTDQHLNSNGYVKNFATTRVTPLQWTNYSQAFDPNRKYVEYDSKVKPFKTTLVSSWYQNQAPALSDLVESTYSDPRFRCSS
jgi:hypothetical protein